MTPERAKELLPIIQAYSEGKRIECRTSYCEWTQIKDPQFGDHSEYRIAKEKKWYRVAQMKDYVANAADNGINNKEYTLKQHPDFIRWLTDRIYYDVE